MKLLKQKILFLLYFRQSFVPLKTFKKEEKYLSYNYLYSLLPEFKQASARKAIGELVESGEVDKISRNRKSFFRLTILGEKKVISLFPNFFAQTSSQKGWFLAILKSKKETRQSKDQLRKLGFTQLKRGVYLKPAAREFGKNLEVLLGKVFVFFSLKLDLIDEKSLVGELWQLDSYHKKSLDFVNQARGLLKKIKTKKRLTVKEKRSISLLKNKYFVLIKNTIGLPRNLLPSDWPMPKAAVLFKKILAQVE